MTTTLVPSPYAAAYFPRTPPVKSYDERISSLLLFAFFIFSSFA